MAKKVVGKVFRSQRVAGYLVTKTVKSGRNQYVFGCGEVTISESQLRDFLKLYEIMNPAPQKLNTISKREIDTYTKLNQNLTLYKSRTGGKLEPSELMYLKSLVN